jgi:transcriptional regulator with XRE-family HTH domain
LRKITLNHENLRVIEGGEPFMTDSRTLLAENIKRYRKALGLSQMALAERVDCSTTLIGNIEIKKRFPSAGNIDRIAHALGVQTADLFTENDTALNVLASKEGVRAKIEQKFLSALNETFREIQFADI